MFHRVIQKVTLAQFFSETRCAIICHHTYGAYKATLHIYNYN